MSLLAAYQLRGKLKTEWPSEWDRLYFYKMGRAAADNRSRGKSSSNTQRGNAARRKSHSGGTKVIQALDCQSKPFSWGSKGAILFCEREWPL